MTDDAIAWRVERACFAAYPPRAMARTGGWQVARSGGGSRRTNAASAITADATLDAATLAGIAALYDADGLPTIVRVTDLVPAASATLDKAGFSASEGPTRTLLRQLYRDDTFDGGAAAVATAPDAAWLSARRRLGGDIEEPEALAARLSIPVAYARYDDGGLVGAVGYVAICDQIAVLEAIATDPIVRRRGFARTVVGALLDWAITHGAAYAALQVEEPNGAARALYAGMGFATDLYGYHYRRRAASLARAPKLESVRS